VAGSKTHYRLHSDSMSDKEEGALNIKLGQDDATSRESGNADRARSPFHSSRNRQRLGCATGSRLRWCCTENKSSGRQKHVNKTSCPALCFVPDKHENSTETCRRGAGVPHLVYVHWSTCARWEGLLGHARHGVQGITRQL
jgi:hypothetical protein